MAKPYGILSWNPQTMAKALKIKKKEVREYMTYGRRASFIIERRINSEFVKGTLAPNENAGYDFSDRAGNKWEVRSITSGGVYFSPSGNVGSGRHFKEEDLTKKMSTLKGYVLADLESFPKIRFWVVLKEQVESWLSEKKLGK